MHRTQIRRKDLLPMSVQNPPLSNYRDLNHRVEAFIAAASKKHGHRYDYGDVRFGYINAHSAVIIRCPDHGVFRQTPNEHRQGASCPDCSGRRSAGAMARAQRFLARAVQVHGDRFDYTQVDFVDQRTPVTIYCRVHGAFTQRPTNHLGGRGCLECATTERAGSLRTAVALRPLPRRTREGKFRSKR
jgi:hypothetical protein